MFIDDGDVPQKLEWKEGEGVILSYINSYRMWLRSKIDS